MRSRSQESQPLMSVTKDKPWPNGDLDFKLPGEGPRLPPIELLDMRDYWEPPTPMEIHCRTWTHFTFFRDCGDLLAGDENSTPSQCTVKSDPRDVRVDPYYH